MLRILINIIKEKVLHVNYICGQLYDKETKIYLI